MTEMTATRHTAAAYGGAGWRPRAGTTADEIGTLWAPYAVRSEHSPLRAVLLHRPGSELGSVADADAALMLEPPDAVLAGAQHDALAAAYRAHDVEVLRVEPAVEPPPNQMYVADLFFMTPAGAILARPASAVRAGEERWVARRLAEAGVPILRSVAGRGTFEGADAMWLDDRTVIVGRGPRTNEEGAAQVADALRPLGVDTIIVDQPPGTMHLMGQLRIVDRDLAVVWQSRIDSQTVLALRARGYAVQPIPDEQEAERTFALNFVTLGPRRIILAAGNLRSTAFYESLGIACVTVDVGELLKAAGGIACLTGVLRRS
jgi:arginine deiminase